MKALFIFFYCIWMFPELIAVHGSDYLDFKMGKELEPLEFKVACEDRASSSFIDVSGVGLAPSIHPRISSFYSVPVYSEQDGNIPIGHIAPPVITKRNKLKRAVPIDWLGYGAPIND